MRKKIEAKDFEGGIGTFILHSYPDKCPICHTSIYPLFVDAVYTPQRKNTIQVVFRCTTAKCFKLFLSNYKFGGKDVYFLSTTEPVYPIQQTFPEQIQDISPTFVEIYNQSMSAESYSLNQLTGIGLRKALEFLVKDFSIYLKEDQEEDIKITPLSQCIDKFIDDEKIKTCAKLAAWLGNDETHYIRKWEDKDISDLKILIRLTVNWIENFLLTEKYTQEMIPKEDNS